MKFIKTIHDRNLTLPAMLIFGYMFVPMIFSQVPANMQNDITYAIPDFEEETTSPLIKTESFGKGGPIDALIWGTEDTSLDQKFEPEPDPVEITRLNKLNYSNARFPVSPADVSSDFGWREPPCDVCSSDHHGVDFIPGAGADVVAILDGMVVQAGINGGFGNWVVIEHLVPSVEVDGEFERWKSLYAHLEDGSIPKNVGIGSIVTKGQLIGLVGNTGVSTGDHLHFEIIIDGIPQDPMPLLATYSRIEILQDGTERFIRYE